MFEDTVARDVPPASAPVPARSLPVRLVRALLILVLTLVGLLTGAWATTAIYFSNLPGESVRAAAAGLFAAGWLAGLIWSYRRRRAAAVLVIGFAAVVVWWWFIPASHDRPWIPEYARMPHAIVDGDRVTVHDIRNFEYRSEDDFDVRYYDRTFDLGDLQSLDIVGSSWGIEGVIHTLLTFGFGNGDHLALSVETRREEGEPQTGLRSLFKQYELIYVLGDECDLLRQRSNVRKEQLFVLPTTLKPEEVRTVFLDVIGRVNDLYEQPRYYNLLTHNCTTSLIPMIRTVRPGPMYDWRYLLNANAVRMAYENGGIASPFPYKRTLEVCHVNQYVEDHPECEGYSVRIRPDLSRFAPEQP